jgi:hypothetical protein
MTNLSELLPAGGGGKTADFVASGTIPNGVGVIINSNGTVSAVSANGFPTVISNAANFNTASTTYIDSAYDPISKKIGLIFDHANQPTFIMGEVSGSGITFGTMYVLKSEAMQAETTSVVYDASFDCFVVTFAYVDGSYNGYFATRHSGKLQDYVAASTNNIGFYSQYNLESYTFGQWAQTRSTYDPIQMRTVIAYRWNSPYNTTYIKSVQITANNSYSPSSQYTLGSQGDANYAQDMVYDSNSNVAVLSYGRSGSLYLRALQLNGSSITVGSEYNLSITAAYPLKLAFDSNSNKIVGGYAHWTGSATLGYVMLITYSSGTFSRTTPVAIPSYTNAEINELSFDSTNNIIGINFKISSTTYFATASVSGNTLSFGSVTQFPGSSSQPEPSYVYDSANEQFVSAYTNYDSSSYGSYSLITPATSNNINFIGTSAAAISNSATGTVTLRGGVADNFSGLTPAATYYVQTDGSITASVSAQKAGKALSSSTLLLAG